MTIPTLVLNITYLYNKARYKQRIDKISKMIFQTQFNKNIAFNPSLVAYFWMITQGTFYFIKSFTELLLHQPLPNYVVHSINIISNKNDNNSINFQLNKNIYFNLIINPNKLTILNIGSCS